MVQRQAFIVTVSAALIAIIWYHLRHEQLQKPSMQEAAIAVSSNDEPNNNPQPIPHEPTLIAQPQEPVSPEPTGADKTVADVRTVTIKNGITKKMITYHKSFMSYTPAFSLEIDGTPLALGAEMSVPITHNSINVTYHYNFLNGYRVGSRTLRIDLAPEVTTFTITFSWKNDNHVIVNDAQAYVVIAKT